MLPAPPALYQTLLHHPDLAKTDMASLRLAVTGAAVIPVELVQQMRDVLGFETVITGYGLTEACGIATMCRHDDDPETIATTSGRAIPGVEVQVVDDDGKEVARSDAGEIVVRGYNVMLGYYDEPAETRATVDDDGWLHTGDIGVMDEKGFVRIVDRKKDMIIVSGFKVFPNEIEQVVAMMPGVLECAVVGVPDPHSGEVPKVYVVKKDPQLTEQDVLEHCKRELTGYKRPKYVEFRTELPKTNVGKILRRALREERKAA